MGCEMPSHNTYPPEQKKHHTAIRTVLLNLPSHDRAYVRGYDMLHEVWSIFNEYMPSVDAEATYYGFSSKVSDSVVGRCKST